MDKTVDELYNDVVAVVKAATGIDAVIRGNQNAPQPNDTYVSVFLIDQSQEGIDAILCKDPAVFAFDGIGDGFDQSSFENEGLAPQVYARAAGSNTFTFSVQFFRGIPMESARRLSRYPLRPLGQEDLNARQIVLRSLSDPLDTSYQVARNWVERASINIVVAAASEFTDKVNVIGEVDLVVNKDETYNIK